MSALGSLVVKLALDHAEYTRGLDRNSQAALKFARDTQTNFDRAGRAATRYFRGIAAGAVGIVASFTGASSASTRFFDAIDKSDSLAKLSQQTGLAVESLAGLDFAATQSGTSLDRTAKGIRAFSRIIADSSGTMNKNVQILQAMGINMDELKDKTPEEQFFRFADAVQELGEQDRAVAVTSLLGDRMAELVPLLSGGSDRLRDLVDEGRRYNPVTAESAAQAELFNDNMDRLGRTVDALFISMSGNLIPTINRISESMLAASQNGGVLRTVLAGVVDVALQINNSLNQNSVTKALSSFFLPAQISDFLGRVDDIKDSATAVNTVTKSVDELQKETKSAARSNNTFAQTLAQFDKGSSRAAGSTRALTREIDAEDKEVNDLRRDIDRLTRAYDPLIERNERLARLLELREGGLRSDIFDQKAAKIIGDYIAATGKAGDSVDQITEKTSRLRDTTFEVFQSNEQFMIQSVRNVQSAFADGLFRFVDDGFKGMVRVARDAALRISAEFASFKILKASGIGALFGLGSSSAFASGGGAGGLGLDGVGSGLLSLVGSGFGVSNLFSSFATSGIGQSLGLSVTGPVSNFGQLSGLGAGLSSALGTLSAGAIGFGIGSAIAGDKKVFGINGSITSAVGSGLGAAFGGPVGAAIGGVIGGGINALFGRDAPKFNREDLVGTLTASGFDGVFNRGFKEKGGLARSSRFSNFIVDTDTGQLLNNFDRLSESGNIPGALRSAATDPSIQRALEIGAILDESIQQIFDSASDTAEKLGLSASALDDFSFAVDLVTEKGKQITEADIFGVIAEAGDSMIKSLIPSIGELSRNGETATETLSRFGDEFSSLENVLRLTGETSAQARELLRGFSIEQRTAFVDSAGGVGRLNGQVDFFFNNILGDSDRLRIKSEDLSRALNAVGVGVIPSVEQLRNAFLSGDLSGELAAAALELAPLIFEVDQLTRSANDAADAVSDLSGLNNAFSALQKSVDAERKRIADEYNDALAISNQRIADVRSEISSLDALTQSLSSSVSTLQPLSRGQALQQIDDAIAAARRGIFPEVDDIKDALSVLTGSQSTSGFRTEFDFLSSRSQAAQKIDELSGIANNELLLQERSLSALEAQRTRLDDGFRRQSTQLDEIITQARLQVDSLSGLDDAILALADALSQFNLASLLARGQSGIDQASRDINSRVRGLRGNNRVVSIPSASGFTLTGGAANLASAVATVSPFQNPNDTMAVSIQLNSVNNTLNEILRQSSDTANILYSATNGNAALKTTT